MIALDTQDHITVFYHFIILLQLCGRKYSSASLDAKAIPTHGSQSQSSIASKQNLHLFILWIHIERFSVFLDGFSVVPG